MGEGNCIAVGSFSLCLKEAGKSDQILSPVKDQCFARSMPWKEHIFLLGNAVPR